MKRIRAFITAWHCPKCGTPNKLTQVICEKCGSPDPRQTKKG